MSVTANVLGFPKTSLDNWVKLSAKGQLKGTGHKPVSAEQMELARLRAQLAGVTMERDILKKPQRTSLRNLCEVRLDSEDKAHHPCGSAGRHAVQLEDMWQQLNKESQTFEIHLAMKLSPMTLCSCLDFEEDMNSRVRQFKPLLEGRLQLNQ